MKPSHREDWPATRTAPALSGFAAAALAACAVVVVLAGCWRSMPPEIQEFKVPVRPTVVEVAASRPDEPDAPAVAEALKVEAAPEDNPSPTAPPPAVAAAAAPAAPAAAPVKAPSIIGTWRATSMSHDGQAMPMPEGMQMTMTFAEDGTLTMEMSAGGQSQSRSGTYTIDGGQITITMDGQTKSGAFTLGDNDNLSLDIDRGQVQLIRF